MSKDVYPFVEEITLNYQKDKIKISYRDGIVGNHKSETVSGLKEKTIMTQNTRVGSFTKRPYTNEVNINFDKPYPQGEWQEQSLYINYNPRLIRGR